MEFGAWFIGMVKTNNKGLCKETVENLTNYWPGHSNLLLMGKPMVPGGRPIIAIGYKYNAQKVLCFIVTENPGLTHAGLTYLSYYPDHFTNVAICPVACHLVMSKFFGAVNEVDSHKKSSKSDLEL